MNGFNFDMDADEYRATDAISVSGLKKIQRTPKHYQYDEIHGQVESDALEFGKGFHMLALEPEKFAQQVVFPPSKEKHPTALASTREMQIWLRAKGLKISGTKQELVERIKEADSRILFWDDVFAQFQSENADKIIIDLDDYERMQAMAREISVHPYASILLRGKGNAEVSAFWMEGDGDLAVPCRARFDFLRTDRIIVDVKTVRNASEAAFREDAYTYGYHMQAYWYMRAYEAVTGVPAAAFAFVCVEKDAPHCVNVFWVRPDINLKLLQKGKEDCEAALDLYRQCRRSGNWHGYPDEMQYLDLPRRVINSMGDY